MPAKFACPIPHKNGYRLHFTFGGKQHRRFLIKDKKLADILQNRVNNFVLEVKYGLRPVPENLSVADFVFCNVVDKPQLELNMRKTIISLSQLIEKYCSDLDFLEKSESTKNTEKVHLRHLQKYIDHKKFDPVLDQINANFFRSYQSHRQETVIKETINKELLTFRSMFNYAIDKLKYRVDNVVKEVKRGEKESKKRYRTTKEIQEKLKNKSYSEKEIKIIKRYRYLNVSEIQRLLALAQNHWLEPILKVFCFTGGRRKEVISLPWENVNFERNIISLVSKKQSRKEKETTRSLSMATQLRESLLKQRTISGNSNWVFPGEKNKHLSVNTLQPAFKRLIKKTEFEGIGFHCLRHSFASILASTEINHKVIGSILGHTTQEMCDLYQHIFPDIKKEAIEKYASLYECEK